MSDFGIKISSNGADAKTATGSKLVLTSKYPLAKIDRTNKVSLQNIRIQFNNNVPKAKTLIYQFKHGYSYTPTIWSLVQCVGVTSPYDADPYIMDGGSILHTSAAAYCDLFVEADSTYVYYYTNRYYDTLIGNPSFNVTIAGVSIRIRTYVFVEDVGM